MKRMVFIALFVLTSLWLLSSCSGDTTATGGLNQLATQSIRRTEKAVNATFSAQQTRAVFDSGQATLLAEQLHATSVAAVVNVTMTAAVDQATSAAMVAQTQQSLAVTGTTQAIVAQANQMYYEQQQRQLDIRRREMLNSILGMTVLLVILGALAVAAWGVWLYISRTVERRELEEVEARSPYVIFDRYGRRMVRELVPSRIAPSPVVDTRFVRPAPPVYQPPNRNGGEVAGVRRANPPEDLPSSAPWQIAVEEWRGRGLPLGLGPDGLIAVDPQTDPHLLITGTPGSGKAVMAVRPLIAGALALGWQAAIFDRTGSDFLVFQPHPNALLTVLNEEGPGETIWYLRRLYEEVQSRKRLMENAGARRWSDLAEHPPELLAVFNNFSYEVGEALADDTRSELWKYARLTAAEGARVGVHVMLVMEDPSFTDTDLRIRRYVSPVAFRADNPLVSRVVLNMDGAENLSTRQFIAILAGQVEFGFAFTPNNNDLRSFMDHHPQAALPAPKWLTEDQEAES